jgi:pimeloyl-ACP methyl ester carboxylesterase
VLFYVALVIDKLDSRFHCVSMDHRGHGDSTHSCPASENDVNWHDLGLDIAHLATDARKETFVADVADKSSAVLSQPLLGVGHSMGATALIIAALERPEQFRGLILYEPIVFPSLYRFVMNRVKTVPIGQAAMRRRPHFPSAAHALANYSSKPPLNMLHPDVLRSYVEHGFVVGECSEGSAARVGIPESGDAAAAERVFLKCRPEYEARVYNGARKLNIFETSLSKLKVPVWIVAGKSEFLQPSMLAYLIHRRVLGSKFIRWNDAGHFGPLEFPDRLAEVIHEFDSHTTGWGRTSN